MDSYGEGLLGRIAMLEDDLHAMTQARDDALRYCETLQADADKARMKTNFCPSCKGYADRIAALEAENARLREHLDIALETLANEGVCGDDCLTCKEARALLYHKDWREVTE